MDTQQLQPIPMHRLQNVAEVPFPPTPWNSKGQMWVGLFKTNFPVQLPAGLKHLLDPQFLLVALIRYLEGTLCYDELVFGAPARLGARVGIHVDYIWVNSLTSLWGGRRVWGLPKNLAEFGWKDSTVRVTDEQGLIATIQLDTSPASLPWMWMLFPGFGQLESGARVYAVGSLWARFGKADMQIAEWPPARFAYRPGHQSAFSFGAKPFRMHAPAPKLISG